MEKIFAQIIIEKEYFPRIFDNYLFIYIFFGEILKDKSYIELKKITFLNSITIKKTVFIIFQIHQEKKYTSIYVRTNFAADKHSLVNNQK